MGRPFVIQTDHWALQWMNKFKEKNARLTRWSLELVEHRKGKDNTNADGLSRLPPRLALEKEEGNVIVQRSPRPRGSNPQVN